MMEYYLAVNLFLAAAPHRLLHADREQHCELASTRHCFTLKLQLWESIIRLLPPPPPAKPALLQYYCTTFAQ